MGRNKSTYWSHDCAWPFERVFLLIVDWVKSAKEVFSKILGDTEMKNYVTSLSAGPAEQLKGGSRSRSSISYWV